MEHHGPRSADADKLRDPRWQRLRLGVMQRDGWRCKLCWDKASTCERCHQGETRARPEAERQLLLTIRMAGLYASEVHKIANALSRLRTRSGLDARLASYVIVTAIKHLLSRREAASKHPAPRLSADQIVPRGAPHPDQQGGRDGGCQDAPAADAGTTVASRHEGCDGGAAAAGRDRGRLFQ
jgi:hypothetical protein